MLRSKFNLQMLKQRLTKLGRVSLGLMALSSMTLSSMAVSFQAAAGEADVVKVKAKETRSGAWSFSVSVKHADAGWNHYANNWEVLSPDGKILATRVLGHPHDNEQPFTRSLSGVNIPEHITEVIIRARDSVHGYGGARIRVDLTTGKAAVDDEVLPEQTDD